MDNKNFMPYNGLGQAYKQKLDFEKSILYYRKSI